MTPATLEDLSSVELELKFAVPIAAFDALVGDLRLGGSKTRRLQAIYYDTVDDRLGAHRVAVRLRKEGRQWIQTAKAATGDDFRRLEHNVAVVVARGQRSPVVDLSRHDGTAVGAAIHAALGGASSREPATALVERFRVDVSRLSRTVQTGDSSIELAVDSGMIVAGRRSMPVCEFELELKSGATVDVFGLAGDWAARHGLWLCTTSKAERGKRLMQGRLEGSPVKAIASSIDARAGAAAFLVTTLKSCLSQIVGNANELGSDAADEQFVHELRVGLRRTRTALRELVGFATDVDPAWEPVLGRAFQALGVLRDQVSVVPAVLEEMRAAGVDCAWSATSAVACPDPGEVVRDPSFQRTLLSLLAFCHSPPVPRGNRADGRKSLRKKLARLLEKIHEGLSQDAKRFPTLSPGDRHRVRKRLKRLRYLSEFARPLFDGKEVDRYLKCWREAQDALGRYNDYRICRDAVSGVIVDDRGDSSALAWLDAQLEACAVRGARALRKAASRHAFWNA